IDAGTDGARTEGGTASEAGTPSPDLGSVGVVDVPSTPCQKSSATRVTVMESEPLGITYERAGVVGSRRFALDPNTLSMLTFDTDGANPSAIVAGILAAAATADGDVATLTSDGQVLALRIYDPAGRALGADTELARGSTGTPALAASAGSLL